MPNFIVKKCQFKTHKKSNFEIHKTTPKHKKDTEISKMPTKEFV